MALQVYDGDAQTGKRLLKLICAIEPKKRSDVPFIISARRGTNPFTVDDMKKLAETKFATVKVINGKRFGSGWPLGPNDLWQETMMRVGQMARAGQLDATGVLTFESDCIPLRPDWISLLAAEWRKGEEQGKECVGHAHGYFDQKTGHTHPITHINGNAIFSANVTYNHPALNGCDARSGWDAYHGDLLLRIGMDTPLIYQRYRIQTITRDEVIAIQKDGKTPALFHGIKSVDGLRAVESMVTDGYFFNRSGQQELAL